MPRAEKITRWLVYGVLISLVPLISRMLLRFLESGEWDPSRPLIGGAMFVVCTGICASAVGELIPGTRGQGIAKLLASGACVVIMLMTAFCFISLDRLPDLNLSRLASASYWMLACTVLAGSACITLAHEDAV